MIKYGRILGYTSMLSELTQDRKNKVNTLQIIIDD
jgi:hypothetical protein